MKKHTCKTCGTIFEYCRGCLLSPIPYKDAGYCSKACQDAEKIEEVIPVEDVEAVVIDEGISTSEEEVVVSSFFSATDETVVNEVPSPVVEKPSTYNPNYNKKKKKNRYKENMSNDNK